MSVLVGSFVWRSPATEAVVPSFTSISSLCTESYIFALTNAAQTDLDSLSASEIILKQFNPRMMIGPMRPGNKIY